MGTVGAFCRGQGLRMVSLAADQFRPMLLFRSQHYEHILPASLRSTLATKLRPFLIVLARTQAVSSSKPGTSHVTSRLEHARVNLRAFDR